MIRRLTSGDIFHVDRLKIAARRHLGVETGRMSSGMRFSNFDYLKFLDATSDVYYAYGAFKDDQLISLASGKMERKDRYWMLNLIISSQSTRINPVNDVDKCIEQLVRSAEAQGIFTYYYAIPKKYNNAHSNLWASLNPTLAEYRRDDFLEVPKYTRCTDSRFLPGLLGNKVFPIDLIIKKVTRV